MKFDHIGIVVEDLENGQRQIGQILPIASFSEEITDPNINVKIVFATDTSSIRYELIAPLNEKSPLGAALKSRKNIINHVAYKTPRFAEAVASYQKLGLLLGAPCPAVAFGGKQVAFFMMPLGIIVELIED